MERKRVVVTGMGIICPTGNTVETAWQNAANGVSGIAYVPRFEAAGLENLFAGEVKDFDPEAFLGKREARRTDRMAQFALYAAQHALEDSGLQITPENCYDIGVVVGTGIGGINTLVNSVKLYLERGARFVSPFMVPMMLPDSASGRISMHFGIRGPNLALSTACATGNNSIGEAAAMIRRGDCVAILAGSSEAALDEITVASFNNMQAISRRRDAADKVSRPFDIDRDGFVVAEGAGVLLLEDLDHALERGAKIYGEILGYGHTSDAHHVTAPLDNGESAAMAMLKALKHANLKPSDIQYINAHGTGTVLNDKSETLAIKSAFGEQAYEIPISSTKSVTGHLMGSAGAVEAIFTLKAMEANFIPPTINLDEPDPECDLNYTPHVGVPHIIQHAMSNSFGFGGHNAVIIIGKYDNSHPAKANGHH